MIFINHHSEMQMQVTQEKPTYQQFENINLSFNLTDKNNQPIYTSFSVAVRDASLSPNNFYVNNILSDLLLSSDLRGYIEEPNYYFESDDKKHLQALDLLMLTQGWSRYIWKEMTNETPRIMSQPMEKGLYVEGTVKSLFRNKPKPNVSVLMFLTNDTTSQHGNTLTDEDGKFNFSITYFYGRQNLTIQTKENNKRKENIIVLDRMFSPPLKIYDYSEEKIPTNNITTSDTLTDSISEKPIQSDIVNEDSLIKERSLSEKIQLLNEVTIKGNKKWKREGEGLRDASIVYNVEKYTDNLIDSDKNLSNNILDFIQLQNPYFSYDIIDNNHYLQGRYKNKNVIFCLDNNSLFAGISSTNNKPMCTYDELSTLIIDQIETISINEQEGTSFLYGNSKIESLTGSEVVVFIYTNQEFKSRNNVTGIRNTHFQGYSAVKEFFNIPPNTSTPNEYDHRRTLYWNPNAKTDTNGNAVITFSNNSSCKTININAETVTKNGIIGTLNK